MNKKSKAKVAAVAVFIIVFGLFFAIAGGSFNASAMASLVSSGDLVPNTPTTLFYEVESHNSNYKMSAVHNTKYGELFRDGSTMINKDVNEFSILVSKVGNPTGFMKAGGMNNQGTFVYYMGAANVETKIQNTPTWMTFRNATDFTITSGTRFGVEFTGGDANNYIVIYVANTNAFNGDLAYKQRWNGTNWVATATEDLTAVIGNTPVTGGTSDTEKPDVKLTAPAEGQTVRNPVVITGTARDNVGLATVEARSVYFNPETQSNVYAPWKVISVGNTGSFSTTLPTADRMTFVSVRATDQAGNIAWDSVNVNFIPDVVNPTPDSTAPVVTITAPVNGVTIASASIEIAGTATDNTAVTNLAWKIDTGNFTPLSLNGASYSFTIPDVPVGSHTVIMRATDAAGNIGTATVNFSTISSIPACPEGQHLEGGVCVPDNIPEQGSTDALVLLGGLGTSGVASIATYRRVA